MDKQGSSAGRFLRVRYGEDVNERELIGRPRFFTSRKDANC
jgi:hypothetical protein